MTRSAVPRSRVLVLAPTARDARITEALLDKVGLACVACENIRDLAEMIRLGAEAALLTEEAIVSEGIDEMIRVLAEQPAWSDFPIVLLVKQFFPPSTSRVLDSLSNVTLLERPSPMRSLVSAVQAAIRSRERQYQLRSVLMENEESFSLLNTLVGNAPVGIACLDAEMRYRLVNRPLAEMNGLPIEAHLGRTLAEVVPDLAAQVEPLFREALAGRPVVDYPLTGHTRKVPGEQRDWLGSWYPIKTANDRMLGVGVIVQEITDRKRAEQEKQLLLESERAARSAAERANRLKDDFLATLSHELRTPLNGILGWAQLLQGNPSRSDADLTRGLEAIARNAKAQAELIEDLLDMGRIISGKLRLDVRTITPAAVVGTAIDTVRPAADARGIRIEQTLDPGAGPIKGDPNRLQQVVWNLLTNAVKFTPRGGKVQVVVKRVDSRVEISVADTGQGIDPEFLPHVFDRFSQADGSSARRHRGLGLGLAIVRNLVEMHGGTVRVDSPGEGKGATFTLALPLVVAPEESNGQPGEHPRKGESTPLDVSLAGLRILVVDDEPDGREVVTRVLQEYHATAFMASSAQDALDILQREKVDLVISDIGMPERDGYWLIQKIRSLPPEDGGTVPAAALTAFARTEDRKRVLLSGYQTHIPKPVEASELITVVASLSGRVPGRGTYP